MPEHTCNNKCFQEARIKFGNILDECKNNSSEILLWAAEWGHIDLIKMVDENYINDDISDYEKLISIWEDPMNQAIVHEEYHVAKWIFSKKGYISDGLFFDIMRGNAKYMGNLI